MTALTTAADTAADARQVGRHLLGERFHVVGISLGGLAALELAARQPGEVQTLTLIATTAGGAGLTPPDDAFLANITGDGTADPERWRRENLALGLSPGWPERHHGQFEALLDEITTSEPVSEEATAAQFDRYANHDVSGVLQDISCPTLILCGAHDRVMPLANSQYLAERLPDARLVVLETGHAIDVEAPKRVITEITSHITRQRRR